MQTRDKLSWDMAHAGRCLCVQGHLRSTSAANAQEGASGEGGAAGVREKVSGDIWALEKVG